MLADAFGQLVQALGRDATVGLVWLAAPLIAGVGWGGLYAAWAEPRLRGPDAVRGLQFALLPFFVGGGLLAPLLAQVGDVTHVAPVGLFTEAVRQGFFGLILGLAYPVLRASQSGSHLP